MRTFFIFNNIKVDTFQLADQPFPGFELLTWESESFVDGTLWDLGYDAGYTPIGSSRVYGQLWLANDLDKINELEYFLGVKSGLTEPMITKVCIGSKIVEETVDATIYRLRKIEKMYTIIPDGRWFIKRIKTL